MENTKTRINSLKKDENQKDKKLRKVSKPELYKINLDNDVAKSYTTLLNKFSQYYKFKIEEYLLNNNKDLGYMTEFQLNEMIKELIEIPCDFDIIPLHDSEAERLCAELVSTRDKKIKSDDVKLLNLTITGTYGSCEEIFIPVGDFIVPKKTRKSKYCFRMGNGKKYKILSLEDVLAFCYLIYESKKVLEESLFDREEAECIFVYAENYNKESLDILDDFGHRKYEFAFPYNWVHVCHLIVEAFSILKERDFSDMLDEKYNKGLRNDYAKSFQQKKNVTEKVLKVMKESSLNNYFECLELDQDTDLIKFKQIEREFEILKDNIDFNKIFKFKKPNLRFRKLGQHKAAGLYYPHVNCICIDIKSPKSFIHELAHCLDYTIDDKINKLSASLDFMKIINTYRRIFVKEINRNKDTPLGAYLNNKKSYYFNQTEIFARSFEIYLSKVKKLESSFLRSDFQLLSGYVYSDEYLNEVKNYFDALLKKVDIKIKEDVSTLVAKDDVLELQKNQTEVENKENKLEVKGKEIEKKENEKNSTNFSKHIVENVKSNAGIKKENKENINESEENELELYILNDKKNINQLTFFNFN
ncbi:hypothetical protein [Clostridium sp.]|uniref:hypothetical protein n=1 Tax=Clostridium sp. TaxID=1506 RepID=UPI003992FDBB